MPRPRKLASAAVYSALHEMREGFEQVFSAMDRLNTSGLRNTDLFEGCRLLAEEAAAWACHQVAEALRDHELQQWTLAERKWSRWQKRNEGPVEEPKTTRNARRTK